MTDPQSPHEPSPAVPTESTSSAPLAPTPSWSASVPSEPLAANSEPEPEPEPEPEQAPEPEPEQAPTHDVPMRAEPAMPPATSSWPLPPPAPSVAAPFPVQDTAPEPAPSPPREVSVPVEVRAGEGAWRAAPDTDPATVAGELSGTVTDEPSAGSTVMSEQDAAPEKAVPTGSTAAPQVEDGPLPADDAPEPPAVHGLGVPVLAALLVVLLGLTGFLGWKAVDTAGQASVETSRTQALAAARDAARVVFSYNYEHLDKDFAAGKAVTTGTFAEQYAGTTAKLLDFAVKNKATVSADVSDASVVRASEDEVLCLVFLNQTSSSSAVQQPRITQSRLEMTMRHRGDAWLVASINAL